MTSTQDQPIYLSVEGRNRLAQRLAEYRQQIERLRTPPPDDASDFADQGIEIEAADTVSRLQDMATALEDLLHRALALSPGPDDGVVREGSTVVIRPEHGPERRFLLVDGAELEENSDDAAIDSPVGRALLGHARGETVTAPTPAGAQRLTIVSVEPYRPPEA